MFTGQTHEDFPSGRLKKSRSTAEQGAGDHRHWVEIARALAAKPPLYWTLQKQTLNLNLLRRIVQDVSSGMALEGLAGADLAYQDQAA